MGADGCSNEQLRAWAICVNVVVSTSETTIRSSEMSGMNWDEMSKEERLLAEQAVLNFRELNKACNDAADGTVLDVCEDMAMRQGRELTRKTIETSLQLQASDVEKRGAPTRMCECGMTRRHRGCRARIITTAAGDIRLSRIYFECLPCREGACLLNRRIGVDGRYSRNAQRLICLAASSWSYDVSSDRMDEFCGLKISDTTIRRVAQLSCSARAAPSVRATTCRGSQHWQWVG